MTPLAQLLARLPRVGEATASRLAAAIAEQPDDWREALAREVLAEGRPARCPTCCDDLGATPCACEDGDPETILVVATPAARQVVSRAWKGRYHVLGGLLPGEPYGARALLHRCRGPVRDVVLALGGSEAADATATWLAGLLRPAGVDVWTLGSGIGCGHDVEHATAAEIVASLAYRRAL